MSIPEEAFPQFTAVAAARPKNRTEGKIHRYFQKSVITKADRFLIALYLTAS